VGTLLKQIGLSGLVSPYVGVSLAMISVVIAATWQMSGYVMAMYLAGLRGIPEELREAGRVDGATEFQIYRLIVMPLLRPITLSAVIILGHISLKIYDLVSAMTGPGPGFATDVPAYYMFDTVFRGNHFSRGAAIAIILLISVAVLTVFSSLSQVFNSQNTRMQSQDDARTAVNQMARYVRSATSSADNMTTQSDAIATAQPQDIEFYCDIDGDELSEKVRYYLAHDAEREAAAARAQSHVYAHHSYARRAERLEDLFEELLR
jgi:ABC-type proline/glycine betaine transport system permease subunit